MSHLDSNPNVSTTGQGTMRTVAVGSVACFGTSHAVSFVGAQKGFDPVAAPDVECRNRSAGKEMHLVATKNNA
jgi:hypothetical protein